MTNDPIDLHSDYFEEEELRKKIRANIDKMDLAQLTIMSAFSEVSAEDKASEIDALINPNPKKRFRRK